MPTTDSLRSKPSKLTPTMSAEKPPKKPAHELEVSFAVITVRNELSTGSKAAMAPHRQNGTLHFVDSAI